MVQIKLIKSRLLMIIIVTMSGFIVSCGSSSKVTGSGDMTGVRENNSVVTDYVNYVDGNNHKTPDHHYIQKALKMLSDAVNVMSREVGHTVTGDIGMANQHADKITVDANSSMHADHIRKAADILSLELQNLQRSKYPGMSGDAGEVRTAALAIDAAVLTSNQKAAIMKFFSTSAAVLKKMN